MVIPGTTWPFTSMPWLQLLPLGLAALNVVHAATSPNDPLRALALQIPKKPELPICCLKPQQPLDTNEDEILLSFEEWKRQQGDVINHTTVTNNPTATPAPVNASGDVPTVPHAEETQKPPHFRVPITDRFNYASSECSARVHLAHRGAKSPSSILSSKRDRYMLSPCNAGKQFVVVELCEDIRIDTVQLANFEFFSGIFKDFKLSVAKTDVTAEGAFTDAGVFRAKNVRGVQSFHPPTSLRDFYRYIRIDFLSHYGNEFYCPVSLLRVYGLTHLEQWKWDTWEQESKEKAETPLKVDATPEEPTSTIEVGTSTEHTHPANVSSTSDSHNETFVTENPVVSSSVVSLFKDVVVVGSVFDPLPPVVVPDTPHDSELTRSTSVSISASGETSLTPSNLVPTTSSTTQPDAPTPVDASQNASTAPSSPSATFNNSKDSASSISVSPTPPSNSKPPAAPNPSPSQHVSQGPGGESIYRTIMNRLTALEANHTLYARYVERQTSGVREVLRRMGEDVGRLEGIVRAQEQVHFKMLRASEERMQLELRELVKKMESLKGEIDMEKRVGLAQVCLLAAVLIFMGLTRGSRGDQGAETTQGGKATARKEGMREWGKRFSSLSGDWRFKRKKTEDPFEQGQYTLVFLLMSRSCLPFVNAHLDTKIQFPRTDSAPSSSADDRPPLAPKTNATRDSALRSISSNVKAPYPRSRSHTPSLRTRQYQHQQHLHHQKIHHSQQHLQHSYPQSTFPETPTRVNTPTLIVPLQRTSSGFSTGHRSARRSRTAHLHEVRGSVMVRRRDENDPGGENPFWDGPRVVGKERGKKGEREREHEGRLKAARAGKGDKTECESDVWVDTDTDLEEDAFMQVSRNGSACD
ncbi:hypothetical protein C0992_002122 [Termitomyces sp. T32_za158]|nr:hypothetical protein C0992_002122 [Termitomyces sp. T32_za158]